MILLDAYALIALLADEAAADEVEGLLRGGDCGASVVNLAEAIDVSCRVHRLAVDEVRDALGALVLGGQLQLRTADAAAAWRTAAIRSAHYAKQTSELSLADCFLVAAATPEDAIATADPPVARAARAEGIEVVPLPDSTGSRP